MQEIFDNWRSFSFTNRTCLLTERLQEAITRRQFIGGGLAAGLFAAIMASDYFNSLPDEDQEKLLDAPTEQLLDLDISDPEYQKAVEEYYAEDGEFFHPTKRRDDLAGMSEEELREHMRMAMNELMFAPAELPEGRPWRVAPVFQSDTTGFYAFISEGDLLAMEETYPGFENKIQDAERFFYDMPLTALWKYTFGQQAFFSYTSDKEANDGKLFATIETEQTRTNPLSGQREKIKVRKLPIAWTIANRVMLDRITILEAELEDPELTREQFEKILERHGVTTAWGKGRSKMKKEHVAAELIRVAQTSLQSMQKAGPVVGNHSNKDEIRIMKEKMEKKC